MNKGKTPEKDGIASEMLQTGGQQLWKILVLRFNRYLAEGQVPSQWKESNTVLLYKKGDREDLKNYRPICLLSHIYKLITVERLLRHLDEQQPREKAGFRKKYSTMDHIFTLIQLLERAREYRLPMCVAFVDYLKAFDSVESNGVFQSLREQRIASQYMDLLRETNSGCTTHVSLLSSPIRVPVQKGVKQWGHHLPEALSGIVSRGK